MADLDDLLRARGIAAAPLSNLSADRAPIATDDSSKGYSVGSTWMRPGTGDMYRARSVAVNAAQWVKVDTADFDTFVSGRFYLPFNVNIGGSFSASTANTLRLSFGVIKQRVTIDQLAFRTLANGSQAALGIYKGVNGAPSGLPVAKTPAFPCTTTATFATALDGGAVTLDPGPYWFGSQLDAQTQCFAYAASGFPASIVGSAVATEILQGNTVQALAISNAFGNWPDLTGAALSVLAGNPVTPVVSFRVASVP